eukprot:XP_001710202.1 Hypothetical protein GL50803_103726 [Giardia lamblia ATCC 50803]
MAIQLFKLTHVKRSKIAGLDRQAGVCFRSISTKVVRQSSSLACKGFDLITLDLQLLLELADFFFARSDQVL